MATVRAHVVAERIKAVLLITQKAEEVALDVALAGVGRSSGII